MAEKGYRFLGISRRVFNILAWLSLGIGGVAAVIICVNRQGPWQSHAALALLLGVFYFFVFGTVSEVTRLLLNIASKINQ